VHGTNTIMISSFSSL